MVRSMNGTGYKLLGYLVWQGGKWYLGRRLPSGRTIAMSGLAAAGVFGAVVVFARRAGG